MMAFEGLKKRVRPIYVPLLEQSPTARILALLAVRQINRSTDYVKDGYDDQWASYEARLDRCKTLDEWLCIPGFDDAPSTHVYKGKIRRNAAGFDTNAYWIDEIERTIRERFPTATSITEYGCGVGRNVLRIKQKFPHMQVYGYELAQPGVEVARKAAQKFGVDAKYAQLDYIKDGPDKYVHPKTDLAMTVFSLEQIPFVSGVAVKNMLDHVALGTIHVEPVTENYPLTYMGVLGRVYSKRVDFLQNFDGSVRALPVREVQKRVLDSSHNPLIPCPSVYALVK